MATTPQTNTTLSEIATVLTEAQSVVIAGHMRPDGDCLGSQLGLAAALRQLGKDVTCTLGADERIESTLANLPGSQEMVFAGDCDIVPDVFVAVDVPNEDRLGPHQWAIHERAGVCVTVDHHAVETCMARYSYTDPDSTSTTILVWDLAECLGVDRTGDIATCCYTGLLTDSGEFCNNNTDARAFNAALQMVQHGVKPGEIASWATQTRTVASLRLEAVVLDRMQLFADGAGVISWLTLDDMAKCQAARSDVDPLVGILRSIDGVRVACMLRETQGDSGTYTRGSLRAKDATDVSVLARAHKGGGHKGAAGFSLACKMPHAIEQMTAEITKLLEA